jgi:hypothetical protein
MRSMLLAVALVVSGCTHSEKSKAAEEVEALNKIMLSGFLWEVAYTFASDFKGWEVSNSDGRVVFLNTKSELLEWVEKNLPNDL